jgi:hypothetical protein
MKDEVELEWFWGKSSLKDEERRWTKPIFFHLLSFHMRRLGNLRHTHRC